MPNTVLLNHVHSLVVLLQVSVQVLSTAERSPQLGCSGRLPDCLQCLYWDIQQRGTTSARVVLQGGAELRERGAGVMVKVPGDTVDMEKRFQQSIKLVRCAEGLYEEFVLSVGRSGQEC